LGSLFLFPLSFPRLGSNRKTIYSVTNQRGFIPALETFGKQVFSEDTSNYKIVKQNDLAFNPSRINVGSVALCPDKNGGAVSPMYTIVRCREGLLPDYLLYFLRSPIGLAEINHRTEGSVRFHLKFADLQRIPIYLPSVSEQKRIMRILDEANELRRRRAQADRRTSDLNSAFFNEMFGDPTNNYPILKLAECAEVVSGVAKGRKFNGREPVVVVPYLRVANVQAGYLDLTEIKTIEALPSEIEELALKKGDVLLTEGGDFDKLGRGAMLEHDIPRCIHQNHVFRVRVNPSTLVPLFFSKFLLTPQAKSYFLRCAKKTTNLASINMTQLRNLTLPVPPLSLQQEFAARIAEVRTLEESQAASRRQLDSFFDSLLHRAFRGEL
jgi:type I restriction enzyme, S subunit